MKSLKNMKRSMRIINMETTKQNEYNQTNRNLWLFQLGVNFLFGVIMAYLVLRGAN